MFLFIELIHTEREIPMLWNCKHKQGHIYICHCKLYLMSSIPWWWHGMISVMQYTITAMPMYSCTHHPLVSWDNGRHYWWWNGNVGDCQECSIIDGEYLIAWWICHLPCWPLGLLGNHVKAQLCCTYIMILDNSNNCSNASSIVVWTIWYWKWGF